MGTVFDPPLSSIEIAQAVPGLAVERHLGDGGQGSVFLARNEAGEHLVIKVYVTVDDERRVDREIKKLGEVSSPHVVKLLGDGHCSLRGISSRYCLIEWIDGPDLTKAQKPFSEQEILRLLREATEGIRALWATRSVHRDLKPANILRASDGRYVIVDLGLAKHLDRSGITELGRWCGTQGYASPEQAAGRGGLTFKSDLFSLGIVAIEMALGKHPYAGRQEVVCAAPPITIHHFSESTNRLLKWATQRNSLDRPSTPEEFLNALQKVMS